MMGCISIYLRRKNLYPLEMKEQLAMDVLMNTIPDRIYKKYDKAIWIDNVMNIFKVINKEIENFLL